jgi:glyoxylase-like metal-dependent hydrolase (beta-lactamase superfamily II)
MRPISSDRLASIADLRNRGIEVLETPGHAAHHVCFRHEALLFVGEAIGTRADTAGGTYRRPATPHRFVPDHGLRSIDTLLDLDPEPDVLLYGHHGAERGHARAHMREARDQVLRWMHVAGSMADVPDDDAHVRARERLLEEDPVFSRFTLLDPDIQEREDVFIRNSLDGLRRSLATNARPDVR